MAYSNITPPTLPSYDSTLYTHYMLEFEYDNGAENWAAVSMRYSATPFTYNGAAVTNAGEHHLQTYGTGTGEWTYWGTLTELSIAPGVTATGGYRRIWTNHNILDGSGNVWLAANTATPAEANQDRLSIMKSKLAGLIMAWCAPVRQFPQREPVAFLYGHVAKEGETPTHIINGVDYVGVIMKALPERDEEKYPFLVVHDVGRWGNWAAAGKTVVANTSNGEYRVRFPDGYLGTDPMRNEDYEFTTEWYPWVEWSEDRSISFSLSKIYWANFDVMDENGKVYLKASDPIPIYGDPVAFLYGHVAKEGETPTLAINGVDYVGTVLSECPQYDTTLYPYAYIVTNILRFSDGWISHECHFIVTQAPACIYYYKDNEELPAIRWEKPCLRAVIDMFYDPETGVWSSYDEGWSKLFENNTDIAIWDDNYNYLWCNRDIYDVDEKLFQEGTAPIPIYE